MLTLYARPVPYRNISSAKKTRNMKKCHSFQFKKMKHSRLIWSLSICHQEQSSFSRLRPTLSITHVQTVDHNPAPNQYNTFITYWSSVSYLPTPASCRPASTNFRPASISCRPASTPFKTDHLENSLECNLMISWTTGWMTNLNHHKNIYLLLLPGFPSFTFNGNSIQLSQD